MGIVQVQEVRRTFEHFSVEEDLKVGAFVAGLSGSQIGREFEFIYNYFPRLGHLRKKTYGLLSGGEQQMLVIGRALITRPKLILLDEPSLGLRPLLVTEIFSIIQRINKDKGTSFLIVEQHAMLSLSIGDYGYVMDNGRVVMDGPADHLKDNEDIKEFYLGATAIAASFALLNFTLSTTTRMQDAVQRGEAIQSAAQLVDRMNPFATPEGEWLLADCAVRWTSRMQGAPKRNVVRFGENGPFEVAMFEVTVTGLRDGAEWFGFTAKQVGFRRVVDDKGPFQ